MSTTCRRRIRARTHTHTPGQSDERRSRTHSCSRMLTIRHALHVSQWKYSERFPRRQKPHCANGACTERFAAREHRSARARAHAHAPNHSDRSRDPGRRQTNGTGRNSTARTPRSCDTDEHTVGRRRTDGISCVQMQIGRPCGRSARRGTSGIRTSPDSTAPGCSKSARSENIP